jgi:hypothetical protein
VEAQQGVIYASADYDGLELRCMAEACICLVGFSNMAEALNAGRDVHTDLAASILGISYEDALARKKEKEVDDARQASKVANFGFAGGLGAETLTLFARKTYKVHLTVPQAKELKAQWQNRWTEFRPYFALAKADVERGAPFVHLFSNRMRGGLRYSQRCNSPFQGLGADATGAAAFLISRACYTPVACAACDGASNGCVWCRPCHGPGISPLYGSRMGNYVHDEFLDECHEAWGHEVAHELVRLMIRGASPYLPHVPPTAKPQLMRYWSKQAEPRYRDGRLIPWPDEVEAA